MSSLTEGLGSAVLDAMAMRQAVVGTTAGGIPEAVVPYETGLLVEPGNSKDLAGAIITLMKDADLRRTFGEAGRERVAEHFGVDRLVEGTLAVYRRVAGR
jgi:glycosyltransferase involved in cell wall biosynthesis